MNHITNSVGADGALATCPYCKKEASYYRRDYICDICGITGYNYECYACNKKEHTDNHTNASCPTCRGTGTTTEACNSNTCIYVNQSIHQYSCSVCQAVQGTSAHTWRNGICRECGATCTHTWNSATGTCNTCGASCTHSGASHANNGKCTTCGYQYETHGQGTTVKYKDITATTHTPYYECTYAGCPAVYEAAAENHTVTTWTDNGDGTHSGTCDKCGKNVSENHTYGTDNKCTKCNSVKVCDLNWTTEKDGTSHWERCTKCNETRNQEAHTITTWTDNGNGTHSGTCDKCGYKSTGDHNYGADDKCTKCGSVKTCDHNWIMEKDGTNHWEKCTKCDLIRNKETHTITTWTDNGNGTHSGTCDKCGYILTRNHTFGDDDKCTDCNSDKPTTECEHDWSVENDATDHWEKCSKCNQIRNKESHTMTAAKDNGNGMHVKTCTKCNFKVTSEHNYGTDGKCKDCGATKPVTECDHNWEDKSDDTNHWKECTKCGEIKDKEKHTVTNWKDNGDGTHSGTCDKCNRTIKGNHNKGTDGKCTDCKANMNNSNNNNNNNNNNNTSGGKVIPNTGAGTAITIGVTVTVALLGIAAVGLKKYKDIV